MYFKNEKTYGKGYENTIDLDDEFIFKRMAMEIIQKMTFDDLKKVFLLKKFDPFNDNHCKFARWNGDKEIIEKIELLREGNKVLFQCEIETED